jgi:hypothetical protein
VQDRLEILHLHDVGRDLPRGEAVCEDAAREQNVECDLSVVGENPEKRRVEVLDEFDQLVDVSPTRIRKRDRQLPVGKGAALPQQTHSGIEQFVMVCDHGSDRSDDSVTPTAVRHDCAQLHVTRRACAALVRTRRGETDSSQVVLRFFGEAGRHE